MERQRRKKHSTLTESQVDLQQDNPLTASEVLGVCLIYRQSTGISQMASPTPILVSISKTKRGEMIEKALRRFTLVMSLHQEIALIIYVTFRLPVINHLLGLEPTHASRLFPTAQHENALEVISSCKNLGMGSAVLAQQLLYHLCKWLDIVFSC